MHSVNGVTNSAQRLSDDRCGTTCASGNGADLPIYASTSHALYYLQNSSLVDVISSLTDNANCELKRFIEGRLNRVAVFSESGNITTIELGSEPLHCYYCLCSLPVNSDEKRQCVVCFLADTSKGLDVFRSQLDQHVNSIVSVLKDCNEDNIPSTVTPMLQSWYHCSVYFICRCVKLLGKDIKYVIYNAVLNGHLNCDTDDKQFESDLERFHSCCNLAALLNQNTDSTSCNTSGSGSLLIDLESEPQPKAKRNVNILCVTYKNGDLAFSDSSCTQFCEDWAISLLEKYAHSLVTTSDVNPYDLKQICDQNRLKTIQDMNSLKRLVKQAEFDFYGLFRAYTFVKSSGNSPVLLLHALAEEQSQHYQSILKLLISKTESQNHAQTAAV